MSFAITGNESVVIYGAGERGKLFADLFYKNGFQIKAILDKKADLLEPIRINNAITIPIVDPNQYVIESENEIVIISLSNGVHHEIIAEFLYKVGFKKIIYIPFRMENNKRLMSDMRQIFNEILEGKCLYDNVPEYSDITVVSFNCITSKKSHLIYMPVENIFTQENFEVGLENLNGVEYVKRKKVMETAGENLLNFKRYIGLYQYLDNAENDCSEYLDTQISNIENVHRERERILQDRYALFNIFEKAFAVNRDFFEDSAPTAAWNKKGYFNIIDGHHRAMYLVYKGVWDIPIRIREQDRQYISLWKQIKGKFWCESPFFVNWEATLAYRKQNAIICNVLLKKDVVGKKICIKLNDAGLLGRYCYRLGCKLCIDIESNEKAEFAKKIYDAFQFSENLKICTQIENEVIADIAILDEEYINQSKNISAQKYILKIEQDGGIYTYIKQKQLKYKWAGSFFDGRKKWQIVIIEKK